MFQAKKINTRKELSSLSGEISDCSSIANILYYLDLDNDNVKKQDILALSHILKTKLKTVKHKLADIRVSLYGFDE